MKKYFKIYLQLVNFSIKQMIEYRANLLIRSSFVPIWGLAMFGVVWVMFNHTNTLGGWNFQEMVVLYLIAQIYFGVVYYSFFEGGFRHLMISGVRLGEFDFHLTKPVNTMFLAMFSRPEISSVITVLITIPILIWYLFYTQIQITFINALLALVATIFSFLIVLFICAAYTTLSFWTGQARQLVELVNKGAEFAQYPLDVFSAPVQMIFFSVLPTFFFGYIITAFLLGKGSAELMIISIVMTIVTYFVNNFAWKIGLKQYSSASS